MLFENLMLGLVDKNIQVATQILKLTNLALDTVHIERVASLIKRYDHGALKTKGLEALIEISGLSEQALDQRHLVEIAKAIRLNEDLVFKDRGIDFLLKVLDLTLKELDLTYIKRVLKVYEMDHRHSDRLEDSFSINQFNSKWPLIASLERLEIIKPDSNVVIWGCWYGSILIPYLRNKVRRIVGIDLDEPTIRFAKNKLFHDSPNVDFIVDDIFATHRNFYKNASLIINTSCEHMAPMNEWKWFDRSLYSEPQISAECHFAFQSNNMKSVDGHINCVESMHAFKQQLPKSAQVILEDEVEDERGTRFTLIGKL